MRIEEEGSLKAVGQMCCVRCLVQLWRTVVSAGACLVSVCRCDGGPAQAHEVVTGGDFVFFDELAPI